MIKNVDNLMSERKPLHHVTIIQWTDHRKLKHLLNDDHEVGRIKAAMERSFYRLSALQNAKIIGCVEVQYQEHMKCVSVHFHLFVSGSTDDELLDFQRMIEKRHKMNSVVIESVEDRDAYTLSYPFKVVTYQRAHDGKIGRPAAKVHTQLMCWLYRQRFQALVILKSFRFEKGMRLVKAGK
jgi:hypothetical protein